MISASKCTLSLNDLNIIISKVLRNSIHCQLQNFRMYQQYRVKIVWQKFRENVTKIIAKLRIRFVAKNIHFKVKNVHLKVKNVHLKAKNVPRSCKDAKFRALCRGLG